MDGWNLIGAPQDGKGPKKLKWKYLFQIGAHVFLECVC
jgi:hypothetical protein